MRTKINKKSDFDFIVLDSGGNPIPFPTDDFSLFVWTWGSKSRFKASSIGGVLTGCKNEDNKLRVFVDNPGFVPGKLVGEFVTQIAKEAYEDGSQKICRYISDFGIDMVNEDSQVNDVQVLAMMQYIQGASAYEIACEYGYQGTEEEWLASLSLDSRTAANECRELMAEFTADENIREANEEARKAAETRREETFVTYATTLAAKEDTANKVTSLDNPSDVTFPTSKAVFDKFEKLDSYDVTSELVLIKNLFIDSRNGNKISETRSAICDYVPVESGETIKVSIAHFVGGPNYFKGYAWYDADKAYISGGRYNGAETDGNIDEYLIAPSNAAYIRASFYNDEEAYGKISFIRTSGRVDKLDNLTQELSEADQSIRQELSEADQSIRQELSKQTGSLVTNTVSSTKIEDYSDTLYKFIVENIPNVGKDCEAVLTKAISYSEGVYMYDKFGQLIGQLLYTHPRTSFTLLANTSRVEFNVRKSYFTLESTISFTYTTSAKDTFYETQLLKRLFVNAAGVNTYYADDNRVIARMRVEGGKGYVFKTNINFEVGSGAPRNTAFYDAKGNLLGVSPVEKFKYIEGYYSYKFETPENAAYIYTSVSGNIYTIKDITTCELVEIKDLNERKVVKPLSVWVLGDSLSATGWNSGVLPIMHTGAVGGWISEFLKRVTIRPIKWYNNAIGGSTLTDTSEDYSQNSFIAQTNSLITKYTNGEISAPDVLIVSGCTNDLEASPKRAITQAEIEASPYNTYEEYVERNFFEVGGDYNHLSLNRLSEINKGKIIGAIRYIVEMVGNLFPKCKYLICTPPQTSRKAYLNEWECVRDMKYAAMRLCIPVADVWGEAQMPMLWDYNDDWTTASDSASPELNHRFLDDGIHTYNSGKGSKSIGYIRQGEYVARKFSEHFINDMIIYEDDE